MVIAGIIGALALIGVGMTFFKGPIAEISLPAEQIIPGFFLTNTMLAAWLTILVLMWLAWQATGFSAAKMSLVPRGIQNLIEALVEALFNFVTSVAGEENGRRFFPLIGTIFLFIMTSAWLALLPGFGTVGVVHEPHHGSGVAFTQLGPLAVIVPGTPNAVEEPKGAAGHEPAAPSGHGEALPPGTIGGVLVPVLRSANTDLNTTLAIALFAMFFVEKWGVQALGLAYFTKFFNFKEGPVGIFVGLLELISEFAKVISFTFRLFGNMFAGEVLLAVITFLVPWVAVLPFLGLEIFVGFVQALVFAGLTLVFAAMAVAGHGEHEEEHGGHGAPAHAAAESH